MLGFRNRRASCPLHVTSAATGTTQRCLQYTEDSTVELLFTGGRVLTIDGLDHIVSGVVVRDGRIVAIGDSDEVRKAVGPEATHVDLRGRALIPGFCDPHNHFSMSTFEPRSVDCRVPPMAGKPAVLDAIAAAASGSPGGQWIWGMGYAAGPSGAGVLSRTELDEVAPNNPACVMDQSYHSCYANSAALAITGIGRDTPNPRRGEILRDERGDATGLLWERAMDSVHHASLRAHIDVLGQEIVADLVEQNARRHLSHGITSLGDAVVLEDSAEIYRLADDRNKVSIAVHQMRGGNEFFAAPEAAASGVLMDDVSDRLRGGIVKIFMDPVWPTFAHTKCHADGTHEPMGEPYYGQDEVDRLVLGAASNGLQVAIHCLGDRAIEQALSAFERAQREIPRGDPRYRIEHMFLPQDGQMERAASLGVMISHQPSFLYAIGDGFDHFRREAGLPFPALPTRSMLDAGLTLASGSDYPCFPVEPLTGLYAMVARRTRSGVEVAADQAITPLEALRTQTPNSAAAMFRDHEVGSIEVGKRADLVVLSHEVGSIEVGKRADLVVLSHDPTLVDPTYIQETVVQQTYVDGDLLYSV